MTSALSAPRGRGRGALNRPPPKVIQSSPELFEIRITEIIDLRTFWAQIGSVKQLEDFDQYCVSLSGQCEDNAAAPQDKPISVHQIVPVRDAVIPGRWHRANIVRILPDRTVEVLYVDTGKSGRVAISDLCTHVPDLATQMSGQALQCCLDGVTELDDNDTLREEAVTRLSEIASCSHSLKASIHSTCDEVLFLSVYTRYEGHWTSVGEILRKEGLVKYTPSDLLTVDHLIISSSPPWNTITSDHSDTDTDSSTLREWSGEVPVTDNLLQTSSSFLLMPPSEFKVDPKASSFTDPEMPPVNPSVNTRESPLTLDTGPKKSPVLPDVNPAVLPLTKEVNLQEVPSAGEVIVPTSHSPNPMTPTDTPPNEADEINFDPSLPVSNKQESLNLALPRLLINSSILKTRAVAIESKIHSKLPVHKDKVPTPPLDVSSSPETIECITPTTTQTAYPTNPSEGEDKPLSRRSAENNSDTEIQYDSDNSSGSGRLIPLVEPSIKEPAIINKLPANKRAQLNLNQKEILPQRSVESTVRRSSTKETEKCDSSHVINSSQDIGWSENVSPPATLLKVDSPRPLEQKLTDVARPSPGQVGAGKRREDKSKGSNESDEDEWDESLLPPRTSSSCPSDCTPFNTPEKGGSRKGDSPNQEGHCGNKRWRAIAQFEAVVGSNEGSEHKQKGYWNSGRRVNRRGKTNHYPSHQSLQHNTFRQQGRNRGGRGILGGRNSQYGQSRGLGRGLQFRDENIAHQFPLDHQFKDASPRAWGDNVPLELVPARVEGYTFEQPPKRRLDPPSAFMPWQLGQRNFEPTTSQPVPSKVNDGSSGFEAPPTSRAVERQLSGEVMMNEVKWHVWMIQKSVEKIIGNLSSDNINNFGQQVMDILNGISAQTLLSLGHDKKPLGAVLDSILSQVTNHNKDDIIIEALSNVFYEKPTCEMLRDAVCAAAAEVATGSTQKKRRHFCSFVQKLFIAASYSGKGEYNHAIGLSVNHCLKIWINCSTKASQQEQVACVECFVALCSNIGPTLDASSKESLDEYFNGPVREIILASGHPRQVKEQLLDLTMRRAAQWDGAKPLLNPQKPPSSTSIFQDTPTLPVQASTSPVPITLQPQVITLPEMTHTQGVAQPHRMTRAQSLVQNAPLLTQNNMYPQYISQQTQNQTFPNSFPQQPSQTFNDIQPTVPATVQIPFSTNQSYTQQLPTEPLSPAMNGYPLTGPDLSRVISSQQYYQGAQQQGGVLHTLPQQPLEQTQSEQEADPYKETIQMLEALGFPERLPTFQEHMLTDFVFNSDPSTVKECLMNAQLPAGAVVMIMNYLEGRRKMKRKLPPTRAASHTSSSPLQTPYHFMQPYSQTTTQRPHQLPPFTPSPQFAPPTPAQALQPHTTMLHPGPNQPPLGFAFPGIQNDMHQVKVPDIVPIKLPTSQPTAPTSAPIAVEADSNRVTARLPTFKHDWHKPEVAADVIERDGLSSDKEGGASGDSESQKGGFARFTCLLCRGNDHSTMECEHRERFFVHM